MNIDPVIIVLAALAVLTVAFAAGRPLKQRADARAAERAQQAAKEAEIL